MSRQRNIVRKPLSATPSPSRTFEERLMLRVPWLYRAVGRLALRRPASSRLRQAVIWRSVSQGLGAVNRRDLSAVLPKYNPNVEIRVVAEFQELGDIEPVYRGREGYLQFYREWLSAWGDGFRFEPRELIDLGDGRLVALAEIKVRGHKSGVELGQRIAFVWTIDNEGRAVREDSFADWGDALEAVGLSEQGNDSGLRAAR
jgi:ketosteroid isomerase-like protein